ALAEVTVEGSPARADDLALLELLAGTHLEGLRTAVADTEVLASTDDTAQVRTVLTQGAHERTSAGVTERVAAQEPRCVVLGLRVVGSGWAVVHVSPCQ